MKITETTGDEKVMYADIISQYKVFIDKIQKGDFNIEEELEFLTPSKLIIGRGGDNKAALNTETTTSSKTMVMDEGCLIIKCVHKGDIYLLKKIKSILENMGLENVSLSETNDILIDGKKVCGSSHVSGTKYSFEMCCLTISTDINLIYSKLPETEQKRVQDDSIRNIRMFKEDFNKQKFINEMKENKKLKV